MLCKRSVGIPFSYSCQRLHKVNLHTGLLLKSLAISGADPDFWKGGGRFIRNDVTI